MVAVMANLLLGELCLITSWALGLLSMLGHCSEFHILARHLFVVLHRVRLKMGQWACSSFMWKLFAIKENYLHLTEKRNTYQLTISSNQFVQKSETKKEILTS